MKKIYKAIVGFGRKIIDFWYYVRNYKNHVDEEKLRDLRVSEFELKNKFLEKKINDLTGEKTNSNDILKSKETEIKELKEKLSSTIRENNSKIDDLTLQLETKDKLLIKENKKVIDLEKQVKEKEGQRKSNASTVGAKQKRINHLEKENGILKKKLKDSDLLVAETMKDIEIANNKIQFYKSKVPEPTIEEVKAYDYSRKEVEKRIKKK